MESAITVEGCGPLAADASLGGWARSPTVWGDSPSPVAPSWPPADNIPLPFCGSAPLAGPLGCHTRWASSFSRVRHQLRGAARAIRPSMACSSLLPPHVSGTEAASRECGFVATSGEAGDERLTDRRLAALGLSPARAPLLPGALQLHHSYGVGWWTRHVVRAQNGLPRFLSMPDWSPVRRFGGYGAWADRERVIIGKPGRARCRSAISRPSAERWAACIGPYDT